MGGEPAAESEPFRLASFDLSDMIRCGRQLRAMPPARCMEDAAQQVAEYLRDVLVAEDGSRGCPLVRCFKTHPLSGLPAELAKIAQASVTSEPSDFPCLTLLGSSGERPAWKGRDGSRGHRAIPLESVAVVERAPMIARLIQQMGLSLHNVLTPTADFLLDAEQRAFGVFHVPEAEGSEFIPAQEFVREEKIRSVLGFGGLLPSGDLFAVILFSQVPITRDVADRFRTIALSTKLILLPFHRGPIFREELERGPQVSDVPSQERQRAEIATLQLLIPALEDVALQQTRKLELAAQEAQQRTEDVRHLNAVLERRVEERTAEWRAANEELKTFSYSVSHDLRAPLRTIDGFSVALQEDYAEALNEEGRGYLGRIRAAAQRMGELIDSMLDLAKVTRAEFKASTVDLSRVAAVIAAELSESAPARVVRFELQGDLTVEGDGPLLRAMLQNLLGNAFKFTGRKTIAAIAFGWSEEQQAYFVKDNGAGFDMRRADKLFQAFGRLHSSEEFEGTGVGLATVARIVRRHGGTLWATGAPGEGATFWFRLAAGPKLDANSVMQTP